MSPSLDESSGTLTLLTPKAKQSQSTRPLRVYTSRHSTPFPYRKQNETFKRAATTSTKCSIPSGMRILTLESSQKSSQTSHAISTLSYTRLNTFMFGTEPSIPSVSRVTNLSRNFHLLNLSEQIPQNSLM